MSSRWLSCSTRAMSSSVSMDSGGVMSSLKMPSCSQVRTLLRT